MTVNWDVQNITDDVRQAALRGVADSIELVKGAAVSKIMSGPKTGLIYRTRGVDHQASAPGESPASDIGRLAQSARTELNPAEISGEVIFSTAYAAAQEFGREDGSIAERPYARPALAESREQIEENIAAEIQEALP